MRRLSSQEWEGRASPIRTRLNQCFGLSSLNHAAFDLIALERLEQRLEVALAKPLVALALDELEEHRTEQGVGEDLQQQARSAAVARTVEEDAACLQFTRVLAVARHARV